MFKIFRVFFCLLIAVLILHAPMPAVCAEADNQGDGFEIRQYEFIGNSVFSIEKLRKVVEPFIGSGKTVADVEKARDAVENFYHDAGFPVVMVNIPEQTLKDAIVRLQVIESNIGQVRVTGNRYFTKEKIVRSLPSLTLGATPYLPQVQEEIWRLNRSQDFRVEPLMVPGAEPGTIDVELRVEDKLPLHGALELSNKSSHDTEELRLNASIRYDNLWQKEHSVSLQYQTAPQDLQEVTVVGGSYAFPPPWDNDHQLAIYGIWSDSEVAFGDGFSVIGKGTIVGVRYLMPLAQYKLYSHNITLGIDYKYFKQAVGFTRPGGGTTETSISYLPLSASYGASMPDGWGGVTLLNAGLNLSLRGVGSDEKKFALKRFKGTGNYFYVTAGIERRQKLTKGVGLLVKVGGQLSTVPLIDNEQYTAGGMQSVRGYKESEGSGDNAAYGTAELSFLNPLKKLGFLKFLRVTPFLFYDVADLTIHEPLPGQNRRIRLEGAGAGMRGNILKYLEYEVDWAVALSKTDRVQKNDQRVYFKVKTLF